VTVTRAEGPGLVDAVRSFARQGSVAVVCLGNELRGDDVVGKLVCEQLSRLCGDRYYIVYAGQDAGRVVGLALEGYRVLAVDAVVYQAGKPGEIVVASLDDVVEDEGLPDSTHRLQLHRFGRHVGSRILLVGVSVDPGNLGVGVTASRQVVEAAHSLVEALAEALGCRERVEPL